MGVIPDKIVEVAGLVAQLDPIKAALRESINRAGYYLTEADPFSEYPFALLRGEYSLKLDFLRGEYVAKNWRDGTVSRVGFDSIITVTRGSGAGRHNHLGTFEWVANNVARIDHDPATVATSTSSVVIGAGLKTFAVSRLYPVGQYVRATADASNWLSGRVVASTGASVTLWVDRVVGSGTHASWTLIRVLGLLVEESRTNLLAQSDNPASSSWGTNFPGGVTVSGNTITESAGSGDRRDRFATGPSGSVAFSTVTYTAEVAVRPKPGSAKRYIQLALPGGVFPSNARRAKIDIEAGTVTWKEDPTVIATATMVGEICVCRITLTAVTSGNGFYGVAVGIDNAPTGELAAYTGDGTSGIELLYADLQAGSFPTSHIPTTTAQVTRAADQCVVSNLADWYRGDEGALSVVGSRSATAPVAQYLATLSDGTGNGDSIRLFFVGGSNQVGSQVLNNGVSSADLFRPESPGANRAVTAWSAANSRLVVNGSDAAIDNTVVLPDAISMLRIGVNADGSLRHLNGHIEQIIGIPRAPTNTELQRSTA